MKIAVVGSGAAGLAATWASSINPLQHQLALITAAASERAQ